MSKYGASLYNFLFNSFNSVIVIINGIIMVPIYFHYFPVSVYGAWLASGNLIAMIGLLESGFSSVITQKMAAAIGSGNNLDYRMLAGANMISAVILSSIILLLALCLSPFVAGIVNVDPEYSSDITWAFVLSAFSSALSIFLSLINAFPQVWQETKINGAFNPIGAIIGIVSLVIYLTCGIGVVSLGLSYVTRSFFMLLFQGRWIYRRNKQRNDGSFIYSMDSVLKLIKDCIYPFISKLAGIFMGHSTSLIIAAFLNPVLAAIYDLTGKIASVLMSSLGMVNGSFFALFSITISKGDKKDTENVVNKVSSMVSCLIVGAIILGICFSKPFINLWVGLDKFGGDWLLIAIVISAAITHFKSFYNNLLFSAGLINKSSILDIICLVSYFLSLLATLSRFEQYALPISLAFSNLCFVWLYINLLKKNVNINMATAISLFIKSFAYPTPIIIIYMLIDLDVSNYVSQSLFFLFAIAYYMGYIVLNRESRQAMIAVYNKIVYKK